MASIAELSLLAILQLLAHHQTRWKGNHLEKENLDSSASRLLLHTILAIQEPGTECLTLQPAFDCLGAPLTIGLVQDLARFTNQQFRQPQCRDGVLVDSLVRDETAQIRYYRSSLAALALLST